MNEHTKEVFLKTFQNILSQIPLPDKKMIPGDEYTQKAPMTVPVGFGNINMLISITYKLKDYSDSLANFDLSVKMNMNTGQDFPAVGSGEGSGVMIYDRRSSYPLEHKMNYTMDMTADSKGLKVHVVLKSESENEYRIKENQ
jgi:hypothetical protein